MPEGSVPDVMAQVAGEQPPVVAIVPEYDEFTVPLGNEVVVIEILARKYEEPNMSSSSGSK